MDKFMLYFVVPLHQHEQRVRDFNDKPPHQK